jgi:hypothetical protein
MSETVKADSSFVPTSLQSLGVSPDPPWGADEFIAAEPILFRYVRSALPFAICKSHRLTRVERTVLPFSPACDLWTFSFTSADAETSPAWIGHVLRNAGKLTLIDFRDSTFFSAIALDDRDLAQSDCLLYVRLYFSLSARARDGDALVESLPPGIVPESVDSAAREKLRDIVPPRRVSSNIVEGMTVYNDTLFHSRFALGNGRIAEHSVAVVSRPLSRPEHPNTLGLQEDWIGQVDSVLGWSIGARRRQTERRETEGRKKLLGRKPADTKDADLDTVAAAAHEAKRRRKAAYAWTTVLSADGVADDRETKAVLRALEERCLDVHIPVIPRPEGGSTDRIIVRRKTLPFYPAHNLYEIVDRTSGRPRSGRFLFCEDLDALPARLRSIRSNEVAGALPGDLIPLSGVSWIIHHLNDGYEIKLSGDAALEYVDFFGDHVYGSGSSFHIVEELEDLRWCGFSQDQQAALGPQLHPMRLWPSTTEGSLLIDSFISYQRSLFHADFLLKSNGEIAMVDDEPFIDRLEAFPHLTTPKTHFFLRRPLPQVRP